MIVKPKNKIEHQRHVINEDYFIQSFNMLAFYILVYLTSLTVALNVYIDLLLLK